MSITLAVLMIAIAVLAVVVTIAAHAEARRTREFLRQVHDDLLRMEAERPK